MILDIYLGDPLLVRMPQHTFDFGICVTEFCLSLLKSKLLLESKQKCSCTLVSPALDTGATSCSSSGVEECSVTSPLALDLGDTVNKVLLYVTHSGTVSLDFGPCLPSSSEARGSILRPA